MAITPHTLILMTTVALTAVAAVIDLRTGLIPNRLVAAGALAAPLYLGAIAWVEGVDRVPAALLSMTAGALVASVVPLILFRMGGLGGGDAKLLAVLGLLLGPSLGLQAELYAFVFAALFGPIKLILDGNLIPSMRASSGLLVSFVTGGRRGQPLEQVNEGLTSLRFGPAILAGTLLVAVTGWTP